MSVTGSNSCKPSIGVSDIVNKCGDALGRDTAVIGHTGFTLVAQCSIKMVVWIRQCKPVCLATEGGKHRHYARIYSMVGGCFIQLTKLLLVLHSFSHTFIWVYIAHSVVIRRVTDYRIANYCRQNKHRRKACF